MVKKKVKSIEKQNYTKWKEKSPASIDNISS